MSNWEKIDCESNVYFAVTGSDSFVIMAIFKTEAQANQYIDMIVKNDPDYCGDAVISEIVGVSGWIWNLSGSAPENSKPWLESSEK